MKILRVFPERTSMTPTDDLVRIGEPDGAPMPEGVDEIHVSCTFTWHREFAEHLYRVWQAAYPDIEVKLGGPAFNAFGDDFVPGRYLRQGVVITSRGCPNKCRFCYVPKREGIIRCLPITEGHELQDNNLLACPESHFAAVCEMLGRQRKYARLVGGLEARRLEPWHIKHMMPLGIREIWLACDHQLAIVAVRRAVEMLYELPTISKVERPRNKLRCYVLVGAGKETVAEADQRLEEVWAAGCMPFAQLYRDDVGPKRFGPQWKALIRKWSRPAAMVTSHKEV